MTPWSWWAGVPGEQCYDLASDCPTREAAIREALRELQPGEQFRVIEARSSEAAKYEGSDFVPFLRTRNHEVLTAGPTLLAELTAQSDADDSESTMAKPFWVLEDPRSRSWSPTPQYLHKDAAFYRTGKWGKLGGGNELFTPDIELARKFTDRAAAEAFRDASPDLKSWAYEACEHAMISA